MFLPRHRVYTVRMKKKNIWLPVLCLMLAVSAQADEYPMRAEDGFRVLSLNDIGYGLLLSDAMEEMDDEARRSGVSFIVLPPEDQNMPSFYGEITGGDGVDMLYQAQACEDGWLAVGSASSTNLDEDWHEGWYDYGEAKTDGWAVFIEQDAQARWQRVYGGSDWDALYGVCRAWDGGWIAVGYTYSSDGDVEGWHDSGELFAQPDGWILHLDEEGNILWQKTLGGSGVDELYRVQPVPGGYLAVGKTDSQDGDVGGGHGDLDGWVVLLDEEGNLRSSFCYGGANEDTLFALAVRDGQYLAVGTTWTQAVDGASGHKEAWALCLDAEGAVQWDIRFIEEGGIPYVHYAVPYGKNWLVSGVTYAGEDVEAWVVSIQEGGAAWRFLNGPI